MIVAAAKAPSIDWAGLSPLVALLGGATLVLLLGLLRPRWVREGLVPLLALGTFGAAIGLGIWQLGEPTDLISGALRIDDLTILASFVFCVGGAATVLLSWRAAAPREAAHGEFYALLLTSAAGMWVLVAAQNLVSLFLGIELLSIPLYVLCATEMRREQSLESGLKYLIIGSVGSATLLYGLALLYGATGSTDYAGIARAAHGVVDDPLRHERLIRRWMLFGLAAWAVWWLVLYHVPRPPQYLMGAYWAERTLIGLVKDQWLCFTYAGGALLLLAKRPALIERMRPIGAAGRMAFTNYVLQAVTIWYLAKPLGIKLHEATYVAAWIVFATVIVLLSHFWLARFRYGPLEWLWRMATYAKREPLRRDADEPLALAMVS